MPKITEQAEDADLKQARENVLADLLGKRPMKAKGDLSNRLLTKAQAMALNILEKGVAMEIITQTVQYGDDKVDPVTKQVRPFAKQKGLIVTLEVGPEEKHWIEHLMKALHKVPLKKREIELFQKHIKRLNYEGALRDYYEFYGLTLKELKDKEEEYRSQAFLTEADRIKDVIERNK